MLIFSLNIDRFNFVDVESSVLILILTEWNNIFYAISIVIISYAFVYLMISLKFQNRATKYG